MITLENGYKLSDKHLYKYFETPMDYLQKCISKFNFYQSRENKSEVMPFSSIVMDKNIHGCSSRYYECRDRIINIVEDTNKELQKIYIGYDNKNKEEKEEIKLQVADLKQECIEYINELSVSEMTMYLLLTALDKKEYRHIQKLIFNTLFGTPNQTFFKMIIDNHGEINKLVETDEGTIILYDFKFIKELINN